MKSICVFCGSRDGSDPAFTDAAKETGLALAMAGIRLVYGGGKVGLMGTVADAALAAGGEVTGVIPDFLLALERGHGSLTELIEVDSMHTRKRVMAERSEGFIALPGGLGTLDELCEILTWAQLGLHRHPVGLLNVQGYFDPFIAFVEDMVEKGFLNQAGRDRILVEDSATLLLRAMREQQVPPGLQILDGEKS